MPHLGVQDMWCVIPKETFDACVECIIKANNAIKRFRG